ncbi:hypothetical protein H5410_064429 [Solanum commersonii]|uniref:Uncharacterized protein n=1 Tax=Solanum commersonii TaxID=4109 RepID=A0A9J5VZD1_SOLCO|nr:hypothetical protein H5410_064429 [Solanum commersonii]
MSTMIRPRRTQRVWARSGVEIATFKLVVPVHYPATGRLGCRHFFFEVLLLLARQEMKNTGLRRNTAVRKQGIHEKS